MKDAIIKLPVNFTATSVGDGHWGMPNGVAVTCSEIQLCISDYGDGAGWETFANLSVTHDADAHKVGLCYTDSGIERKVAEVVLAHDILSKVLTCDPSGSEQGMQDTFTYNCDVEVSNDLNDELLIALGFSISEF